MMQALYPSGYLKANLMLVLVSVEVPWWSGLMPWICVLMAESSECGFEPPTATATATATVVLMSLSKTLYRNCFSPPRNKWVPVSWLFD